MTKLHAVLRIALQVRDAGIRGISISMRDITERKRLEQDVLDVYGRERQSLVRDLHDGLDQRADRNCADARVVGSSRPNSLSETNVSHLYRIAQEANAARHGSVTLVNIFPAASATAFSPRITDHGEGIVHGAQPSTGMGLKITKYRADVIGAMFEIETNEPHGAVIIVAG
jgi:signal transduction histidine kinase